MAFITHSVVHLKAPVVRTLMTKFVPRLDILPAAQQRLWTELNEVPPEFVLYGGTAIALHLGHRESIDFDFFGNETFDPAKLMPKVRFMAGAHNPQITLKALSFFDEGNVRNLPEDMKSRLAAAARDVDLDQLPKISDCVAEHEPKPERGRGR
jgi:hypothetical protein